jgi:hypothetical protein
LVQARYGNAQVRVLGFALVKALLHGRQGFFQPLVEHPANHDYHHCNKCFHEVVRRKFPDPARWGGSK